MAKSLLGIDLLDVKVAKERQIGRELNKDEELELYERELRELERAIGVSRNWISGSMLPSACMLIFFLFPL